MPCLNEAATVAVCVAKATEFLASTGITGEVIVADNGSTDGSQELATAAGARVVPVERKGYGAALLGGIKAAHGTFVIMGDADDSYDFSSLAPFVERLRAGDDLVMGNRFMGGIAPGAMRPLHRYLGNPVLSGVGRLFFGSPIGDFHCGLRGFRKDAVDRIAPETEGMEFASEMIVRATLNGLKISEVPTTLAVDGRDRPPHLRTWQDGWRHLRFLLAFSPRWLFLIPGALLLILGLAVGAWLLPGGKTIGAVGFDTTTLIYASAAVTLGAECLFFALFSKLFAIRAGLHPSTALMTAVLKSFTLERGIIVSLLIVAAGLAGSLYAVGFWGSRDFGALSPSQIMRIAIPSVTALTLGGQIFFASFFLWLLGLGARKLE